MQPSVPVNDEALSGLVSESSGLLWSSWLGSSVDGVEVSVLPDPNSKTECQASKSGERGVTAASIA